MRIIDLSHTIRAGMPVYPGDSEVVINQDKKLTVDFYNAYTLSTGMHAGTHVDMPAHLTECEVTADNYQLDNFVGEGVLLDFRGRDILEYNYQFDSRLSEGQIAVIYTGFSNHYHYDSNRYYNDFPAFTMELAQFLIRKKIKAVAIDTPSPDKPPFVIHKLLLEYGIFIIENVTNLGELYNAMPKRFYVHAAPIKIEAEAGLVRAYAVLD